MDSEERKRLKIRRRPPVGIDDAGIRGNWELENAPFTFEGQIEGLGRIGRNLSTSPRWMRVTAKVVAATFIVPFVIYAVNWLLID